MFGHGQATEQGLDGRSNERRRLGRARRRLLQSRQPRRRKEGEDKSEARSERKTESKRVNKLEVLTADLGRGRVAIKSNTAVLGALVTSPREGQECRWTVSKGLQSNQTQLLVTTK